MRLILVFALASLLFVYGVDQFTASRTSLKPMGWDGVVMVRQEGRFCPLYYPAAPR